jgi:MFS superfamily sulfate permease-like transporter
MLTLVGVVVLDVLPGLVIGVTLSILVLAFVASRPVFSVLGTRPGVPGGYEDVRRHDTARPVPGVLIIRPDAPLFYANAQPLRDTVTELVRAAGPGVHTVILDLDANDDLDITSSEVLEKLAAALGRQHVRLALAHLHAPARDMLTHFGLTGEEGSCRVFPTLEAAVSWARAEPAAPQTVRPPPGG